VEPDRFDDVAFRVLEEPEPPRRPPRLRRWTLGALSAVLATGAFAAGASALSGGEGTTPAPKGDAAAPEPDYRGFRGCEKGERHGKRERRSSDLRY
jgi:hypothetical protein